jgi:hypothetical protein
MKILLTTNLLVSACWVTSHDRRPELCLIGSSTLKSPASLIDRFFCLPRILVDHLIRTIFARGILVLRLCPSSRDCLELDPKTVPDLNR